MFDRTLLPRAQHTAPPSPAASPVTTGKKSTAASGLATDIQSTPARAPVRLDYFAPSGGRNLPQAVRSRYEPLFGHSLQDVRIHTGREANMLAHGVGARAYTIGQDVVFADGEYEPDTGTGDHLLAHELSHTVQQRGASAGTASLGISRPFDRAEREADHAADAVTRGARAGAMSSEGAHVARTKADAIAAAAQIREALAFINPVAGVGDFPKAFGILQNLPSTEQLLDTIDQLAWHEITLIRANIGSASVGAGRIEAALFASLYRQTPSQLSAADRTAAATLIKGLSVTDLATVKTYLGDHRATQLLESDAKEVDRLAAEQAAFWEKQRKEEEARAKKEAEDEAKKAGTAPPPAPTVDVGKMLDKKTKERGFSVHPTTEWDSADQKDWKDNRAPAAWKKVLTSVIGTELEQVMKGKTYAFDPEAMLKNGWFAYQSGNALAFGMSWVKLAEADPKNVWPNIAHELGGHFEYGTTYVSAIMTKAIDLLPEPTRTEWKEPERQKQIFYAYQYSETEVFACLRALRYFDPLSGKKPTYGGLDPYVNIDNNLKKIKGGFPPSVAESILIELKKKVDTANEILDRDKKYFVDQVKLVLGFELP